MSASQQSPGERDPALPPVDVVAIAAEQDDSERRVLPGTDSYQAPSPEVLTPKEMLWALCAAFGFAGGVPAAVGMPVIGFYFPLGLGAASVAMGIAAMTRPGETPWYGVLGLLAGVIGLLAGYDGYDQFNSI